MPNGAESSPGPRSTKFAGGMHAGAEAPSTEGGWPNPGGGPPGPRPAPRPPAPPAGGPPRAGGGAPPAYVSRASNTPSLFASRSTVIVLVPGELTNRSPFGAYTIMRGDGSSAYVVMVKPAGTDGVTPSGLVPPRLGFGLAWPGAGSLPATGCGITVFCCATRTTVVAATHA